MALKECGYKPYDFIDRFRAGHLPRWDEAMNAKFYGKGKPTGKKELDELTGDFDVWSPRTSRLGSEEH